MEKSKLISPDKKHAITFGEMEEQAMGGAYYCPIFLNYIECSEIPNTFGTEGSAPLLLNERNTGNAVWKDNNTVFFPIWMRSKEGYLKQQIAFFDLEKSQITVFEKQYDVVEIKAIKGNMMEAINSPHWQPKDIEIDLKTEKKGQSFSWTKIDTEFVAIKNRMFGAKGGNWYAVEKQDPTTGYRSIITNIEHIGDVDNPNQGKLTFYSGETAADIDFIAHARQDIPTLLKEIERLKTDKKGTESLISDSELQAVKARCEATTIAPWVSSIEGRDHELGGSSFIMTGIKKGDYIWDEKRGEDLEFDGTPADLDFIAHARQDIPMLIAEIERLKGLLK
jgi:hypothetical protein